MDHTAFWIEGIVGLVMILLNIAGGKKISKNSEGDYVLRLGNLYSYFGIGFILLGIGGSFFMYLSGKEDAWLMGLSFFVLTLMGSVIVLIWYVNHKVVYNDHIISSTSYLGRTTSMRWSDIEKVKFAKAIGMLILADYRGNKVRAHKDLGRFQ